MQFFKKLVAGLTIFAAGLLVFGLSLGTTHAANGEFTTTWKVGASGYGNGDDATSGNIIEFGINGVDDITIDWGDGGNSEVIPSSTYSYHNISHTYSSPGDYTVKISGDLRQFYNNGFSTYLGKLVAVTDRGDMNWNSMQNMFRYADNLLNLPSDAPNLAGVTDMSWMFFGAENFNQDISNRDVSNITNMEAVFNGASAFNQDISSWDVSNVTNMNSMFNDATTFNQNLSNRCVPQISTKPTNFDTSAGFAGIAAIQPQRGTCPLDNNRARSFQVEVQVGANTEVDFGLATGTVNFVDRGDGSAVESAITSNLKHTYTDAGSYTVKILGDDLHLKLKNVSGSDSYVTDVKQWGDVQWSSMYEMFSNNNKISTFTATDTPDLHQVTNMASMFSVASPNSPSLFNSDISNWDVSNVEDMRYMFAGSIFNQDISSWDVSNVEDMRYMFIDSIFNQDISSWVVSNVEDMRYMFAESIFNQDISSWDVSSVKNMESMFAGSIFNQDISSWDVSNVEDMRYMFAGSIFNQDISSWDVSNVEDMRYMFIGSIFNQDISSWDVSNVEDMRYMFINSIFNQDISNWDVSSVKIMEGMFDNSGLSTPHYDAILSGWASQSVQDNVKLGAAGIHYCLSETARQSLIVDYSWVIADAGELCNFPVLTSPGDGAILNHSSPLFTWDNPTDMAGHERYVVWIVKPDNTSQRIDVINDNTLDLDSGLPTILPDGDYSWYVENRSDLNTVIATSETRHFSIDTSPVVTPPSSSGGGYSIPTAPQDTPSQQEPTQELSEIEQAYERAYTRSITTMPSFEEARVYDGLTRAEFAKMIVNYAQSENLGNLDTDASCEFSDLDQVNSELADYAVVSCQYGLMGQNTNGIFQPNNTISRAEVVTVLSRLYGRARDAEPYYIDHMAAMLERGYITQDTPDLAELRGYMFIMLQRIAENN